MKINILNSLQKRIQILKTSDFVRIYATFWAFFEIIFQNELYHALLKPQQPEQLRYCPGC